ncbi:MAG: hypothetical protein IKQ06_06630 [Bacilli bacterium]|nr:hypothetical protein [Bacilli bacterium]
MNNLITVFMNYKLNRLVDYGVVVYQNESPFIRGVFGSYFQTYIDNYYYGIFNTIDNGSYNEENLKLEFNGIMEEMLYDYEEYKNKVSQEEYLNNQKIIRDLKDIALLIVPIDTLEFDSEDDVSVKMEDFFNTSNLMVGNRKDKLIKMIKDTYVMQKKLLDYENPDFTFGERRFHEVRDCVWIDLVPSIPSLEGYRKGLIDKVNSDNSLVLSKLECLVQIISLMLLKNFLEKKESRKMFISLDDSLISRLGIDEDVLSLIDNPMFQKNVYLAVSYNTYSRYRNTFIEDYNFAFTQDFSHINDIFQKIDAIYNEGFSHYLIVTDCRDDDKDYFINYKNEVMSVLMFEEE